MENSLQILLSLLTAIALSGLIGLEREMQTPQNQKKSTTGGVRTFAMTGAIGCIVTYGAITMATPFLIGIVFCVLFGFALIAHGWRSFLHGQGGITSEISLIASFLIGMFTAQQEIFLALSVSIVFTSILALKKWVHSLAHQISSQELFAILQFLIVSFVVLQILPARFVDPWNFFDWRPRLIWLMVVFVAAIRFIGYFFAKFIGTTKSILLSGMVGGLVSSTAVTTSLAQESKGQNRYKIFLLAILLATGIMFFRVLFEISFLSPDLLHVIAPALITMGVVSFLGALTLLFAREQQGANLGTQIQIEQPLDLKSAVLFGAFFLGILLLSEKMLHWDIVINSGLLLTGAIAGLTDVDAITLAMANLVRDGEIAVQLASEVVFLAVIVNTLVKGGIVFVFGSRQLLKSFLIFLVLILSSGIGAFFWNI